MENSNKNVFFVLAILAGVYMIGTCEGAPEPRYRFVRPSAEENDYVYKYIPDIRKLLELNPTPRVFLTEKRGIDFGLGRGYSGSQAARHMLGLQQASFAGGPGKRSDPYMNLDQEMY
ncbi:uncharacterized protein LOC111695558 [Eurytemora carolleeae]|uniref:uncharacterized protein LOC111695558 n=1 Tax=Eurytemora carolleeae TaxID=1294199 RepID=UPI000C76EEC2|nr:uncharacterized protein LOC111695558 [Eurytemora carolleeae]|eukprot:XP_023320691.1 uncharacterized protein LOC111695558 [Eurytemora affinis]